MHKFHLHKELILDILSMCSGIANSGRPTRKCTGVNTTIPSIGVESNGTSGLLFMVASTSAKTVNISSIVRIHEPTERLHCLYCHLPKSSEMWCSARNMTPIDPLGDAKLIDLISD